VLDSDGTYHVFPDQIPNELFYLSALSSAIFFAGTVSAIKVTAKSVYLKLTDTFAVRIKKEHLRYFEDVQSLKGRKIEVRGWVNRYKKGYIMLLKHPSALREL
jgi:hypothetical protein